MKNDQKISLIQKQLLRSDYGEISLGWVLSADFVSWSCTDADDLLISRSWEGIYLYPMKKFNDSDLNKEPIKVCPSVTVPTLALPVDWNKDGQDDLIISDRRGFLYFMERKGKFPDITFNDLEVFADKSKGLKFNIPYENPYLDTTDDLGGYTDSEFYNCLYPVYYPDHEGRINLIVGDWGGNLWWMPDVSDGKGKPEYQGVKYFKSDDGIKTKTGKEFIDLYGYEYVKPTEKICDEKGELYLLGDGVDAENVFIGGKTRPVLYKNNITGSYDLIVLSGMKNKRIYYLERVNTNTDRKPVFRNLGEIELDCFGRKTNPEVVICQKNEWNNIMVISDFSIALFKNKRVHNSKPEFKFDRFISSENAITNGSTFSEILSDIKGRRYLLDIPSEFKLREIKVDNKEVKLSSEEVILQDQQGVFKPEGETDPQGGKDWGFHRASIWDFDGSGKQHLIVGTDKGLFYLLVEEEKLGTNGEFKYKSIGPLKDEEGKVIKVHNRACACAIDLDGDGVEDLVFGGASYQLGIKTDPNPGGGFYYARYKGLDRHGNPVLESLKPLDIRGHKFNFQTNTHVHLQAVDIDKDGIKEIILANQEDGFKGWIFKPANTYIGVEYTGKYVEHVWWEKLLDIDDDGELELVWAGSEEGIGYYFKLLQNMS